MPDSQTGEVGRSITLRGQIPVQDAGYASLIPKDVMASQIPMGEDSILLDETCEGFDRSSGHGPHLEVKPWKYLFDLDPVPIRTAAK